MISLVLRRKSKNKNIKTAGGPERQMDTRQRCDCIVCTGSSACRRKETFLFMGSQACAVTVAHVSPAFFYKWPRFYLDVQERRERVNSQIGLRWQQARSVGGGEDYEERGVVVGWRHDNVGVSLQSFPFKMREDESKSRVS